MRWEQQLLYATLSDIGLRRRNNQDSFCVQKCSEKEVWAKHGHIFVVADGMGGHAVGELASKIAIDTIPLAFFKSRAEKVGGALTEAIENANKAIFERGSSNVDFNRMGTTAVVLVLCPKGAVIGHVGDSRAYRVRGDRIEQLSFDHSLHWELERQGRLKKNDVFLSEVKHVITRSLGPEASVEVEIDGPISVFADDRYLLCSDGLTGNVTDSEIGMVVRELPPDEAVRLLVNLANLRGGSDNTTVIIVDCGDLAALQLHSPDAETTEGPRRRSKWRTMLLFALGVLSGGVAAAAIWQRWYVTAAAAFTVALLGIVFSIKRERPPEVAFVDVDTEETVTHRPYRVASARTTKEFMTNLAQFEMELRKMASEELWSIDWKVHAQLVAAAKLSLDSKRTASAMSELGKSIDMLMTGFHAYRKKQKQAAAAAAAAADPEGGSTDH